MAKMFLMTGPSGAGKTTLAMQLARERGLRYLGIENFYLAFFGDETVHNHEEEVWQSFAEAIRLAGMDGVDVLIDTNAPSREDREWFVKRFSEFEISLIIVEAAEELCRLNNQARARKIPESEMNEIFARLEPVADDEMAQYVGAELYRNTDNSGVKFVKKIKG